VTSTWSSKDILFNGGLQNPEVEFPFVDKQLDNGAVAVTQAPIIMDSRQALLRLGIVLLEILLNATLDKQTFYSD